MNLNIERMTKKVYLNVLLFFAAFSLLTLTSCKQGAKGGRETGKPTTA